MRIKINEDDLMLLLWYARRYCDDKQTPAPNEFNKIYDKVMIDNPGLDELDHKDIMLFNRGSNWPYARDALRLRDVSG